MLGLTPAIPATRKRHQPMNEYEAKMAWRELGIFRPSKQMIENFIRADEAERRLAEAEQPENPERPEHSDPPTPRSDGRKRGSSRSNLAKALREQGQRVIKKITPGQRGRPRITAEWFGEVAASVAGGLSLPEALWEHHISLDAKALRALSRNREFRALLEQERQRYAQRMKYLPSGASGAVLVTPCPSQPESQNSNSTERQIEEPEAR